MLRTLKSLVKSNATLHRFAIAVRHFIRSTTNDFLQRMVRAAAEHVEHPVFVKVGAHDGLTDDPFGDSLLTNRQWTGILIEPVPHCAALLRRNYSDTTRFSIEQTAVGQTSGSAEFYYVSETARHSLPDFAEVFDQIGSFNRRHIMNHGDGKLEPFIVAEAVKIEPLADILRRHRLSYVTLLHIDTEGYDLEVLKSLNLPELCPAWISIEHIFLSAADRTELLALLESADYDVCDADGDYFAMHRSAPEALRRSGNIGRMFKRPLIAPAR